MARSPSGPWRCAFGDHGGLEEQQQMLEDETLSEHDGDSMLTPVKVWVLSSCGLRPFADGRTPNCPAVRVCSSP